MSALNERRRNPLGLATIPSSGRVNARITWLARAPLHGIPSDEYEIRHGCVSAATCAELRRCVMEDRPLQEPGASPPLSPNLYGERKQEEMAAIGN